MTWMIDTGRPSVVPRIMSHQTEDGERFIFKERDFLLPAGAPERSVEFIAPPPVASIDFTRGCPPPAQILVSVSILLSPKALEALKTIQPDGWEAFPIRIIVDPDDRPEHLASDIYYLMRAESRPDVIDLHKSDLKREDLALGSRILERYVLSAKKRLIAVRKQQISGRHLWRSDNMGFAKVQFVSDALKDAWCEIGMNPDVFEPCLEV